MNISKVLIACDSNYFANMYPLVRKMWKSICGYDCTVIFIGDELPDVLKKDGYRDDEVILFKKIENMHTAFQSQCIRVLYPALMEGYIMTSDMDIVPLRKNHYELPIQKCGKDDFVTFTDRYTREKMYAICYNVASSEVWSKLFNIKTEEDVRKVLKNWYSECPNYDGRKNCEGWYTDQKKLFMTVSSYPNLRVLNDSETNFCRLDKKHKIYIVQNRNEVINDIKSQRYSDFHFIKPYAKFNKVINMLTDAAISQIKT